MRYQDDYGAMRIVASDTVLYIQFITWTGLLVDSLKLRKNPVLISERSSMSGEMEIAHVRVYPNPFNGMVQVHLQLRVPQFVRLEVWNVLGKRIAILYYRSLNFKIHYFSWKAAQSLAGGMYFLKVAISNKVYWRKLLFIK